MRTYVLFTDLLRQRRLSLYTFGLAPKDIVLLMSHLHFERIHGLLDVGQLLVEIILCAGGSGATLLPVLLAEGRTRVGTDSACLLERGLEAVES